jgi:protein-disulfide isomerase
METAPQLTKAERKALKKQEKAALRKANTKKQRLSRGLKIALVVGVVGGLGWWVISRQVSVPMSEIDKPVDQVLPNDWYLGNKEAKVVVIEYSDFQCPTCALYSPIVRQLANEYGNQIAIVYRYFPLKQIHPQAVLTAQAAEAAGRQGKFWEMNELLFDKQEEWAGKNNAKKLIEDYAQSMGLNLNQFNQDINSKPVRQKVEADYLSSLKNRLNSTPSFYINGERIMNPQGVDAFKQVLDQKIVEATAAAQTTK